MVVIAPERNETNKSFVFIVALWWNGVVCSPPIPYWRSIQGQYGRSDSSAFRILKVRDPSRGGGSLTPPLPSDAPLLGS